MKQEKLLWQLQELIQEEFSLRKKHELKPLIKELKDLQESIKRGEEHSADLKQQKLESEDKAAKLENEVYSLNSRIKGGKDKLYGKKGGSLKELLSLQQSVLKMEEEVEKNEAMYFETLKKAEELKEKQLQVSAMIKAMKKEYNEKVRGYKEKTQHLELKLAENELRQEEIKEQLKPEILNIFLEVKKRFQEKPVALLKGDVCTGCRISIPSVLAVRIRAGETVHKCESCGRILIHQG